MKILIAIDGSTFSDEALREVGEHAWALGSEARVITVDGRINESSLGVSSSYDDFISRERQEAHRVLAAGAESLRGMARDLTITSALLEGSPKEAIIAEARRWGADLVVVGSQGRHAIKSLLLGSVSLAVILQAPCSVLVVRKPERAGVA